MTNNQIYGLVRFCPHLKNVSRIYKGWIRSEKNIIGFWGHLNSNLGKKEKIERTQKYLDEKNIPVVVIDDHSHLTRVKIILVETEESKLPVLKPPTKETVF